MRTAALGTAGLGLAVGLGLWVGWRSGDQPERDAVAAAERELGMHLESRRVDVGEVALHVVLAGPADGPPVVLLHGFPEFWYAWRGPLAVLAREGFRVIAPDQRGYNRSDKPGGVEAYRVDRLAADVAGLVAALGHERAHLAAHDWGGAVAWHVALRHPERVRRLAVIDTPHPYAWRDPASDEDTVSWYRTFLQLPWLPSFVARLDDWSILATSLRDSSRPGTFPDAALDLYRSAWDRDGAFAAMARWYRAGAPPPPADGRVRAPTLVLLAADDVFLPADRTRRSLEWLDDGRLLELGSGTHWVIQEEPERIGALLAAFFAGGGPSP